MCKSSVSGLFLSLEARVLRPSSRSTGSNLRATARFPLCPIIYCTITYFHCVVFRSSSRWHLGNSGGSCHNSNVKGILLELIHSIGSHDKLPWRMHHGSLLTCLIQFLKESRVIASQCKESFSQCCKGKTKLSSLGSDTFPQSRLTYQSSEPDRTHLRHCIPVARIALTISFRAVPR